MKLTQAEEWASHDCLICKLSVWEDDGSFKECISRDNNSKRPVVECPNYEAEEVS